MTTYSIHPNSHRIDKTNFATKDEAIARALECARILNRGVSVYEVKEAGTDTQKDDYPKVSSPITHIAFVLPDGKVQNGEHPAIQLMEYMEGVNTDNKEPSKKKEKSIEEKYDEGVKTFPFAIGNLEKLVRTLDDVSRLNNIPENLKVEASAAADSIQNHIFSTRKEVQEKKHLENEQGLKALFSLDIPKETSKKSEKTVIASITSPEQSEHFAKVFKPGLVLKEKQSSAFIHVQEYDPKTDIVTFAMVKNYDRYTKDGFVSEPGTVILRAKAYALSKVILKGDFEMNPMDAKPCGPQEGAGQGNWNPEVILNPDMKDHKRHENEVEEKNKNTSLVDILNDVGVAEDNNSLLAYCMGICANNIYDADELASAFLDAYSPKTTNANRLTTVAQLKDMRNFRGHDLPVGWFVTAQKTTLIQLNSYRPAVAMAPPTEVQRAAASALKMINDKGVKLPSLARNMAKRISTGQAIDLSGMERMYMYFNKYAKADAQENPLEYHAWGGIAGQMWVEQALASVPKKAVASEV